MLIDISFIMMVAYGFYFGYVYGPIQAFLWVISLILSLAAAMRFTPVMVQLIKDIFQTDSPFLPFLAFILTMLSVMMVSRLISQILLETFLSTKFSTTIKMVGGIVMSATFAFLFSVLVAFFSSADVIKPDTARRTSFTYQYVEQIPAYGKQALRTILPFLEEFIVYMERAMQRLERGERKPKTRLIMMDSTGNPILVPESDTGLYDTEEPLPAEEEPTDEVVDSTATGEE